MKITKSYLLRTPLIFGIAVIPTLLTSGHLCFASNVKGTPSRITEGFITESLPLPISVDGKQIPSSILLQFDIQRYGIPLEVFAAKQLDTDQKTFRDFVFALRTGDLAKVAALRPGDKPEQIRTIMALFPRAYAEPQSLKVIGRVPLGDRQLFVCEWAAPTGPVQFGFELQRPPKGSPRIEVTFSDRPLESLIVEALQQNATHPQPYVSMEPERRYSYTFPLAGTPTASSHPVIMHFNGQSLDATMFSGKDQRSTNAASDPSERPAAISTYLGAYRALEGRDLEPFLNSYTDKSRDKLRIWFEKMTPTDFNSYILTTTQPRRLRFLLDADPVALVFYTLGEQGRLHYEYLLRDGARYNLTNAYFEDVLDDVLRKGALFPVDFESFKANVLLASDSK